MKGPTAVSLYAFNVGFGDGLLLRFDYPDRPRFVLCDLGSTAAPGGRKSWLERVAGGIRDVIAAEQARFPAAHLDAIVATHRHRDHIQGFSGKPWKIIHGLRPELIVLPWTEDLRAAPDATKPTATRMRPMDTGSKSLAGPLEDLERLGAASRREPVNRVGTLPRDAAQELHFLGEKGLTNKKAVLNLHSVEMDLVSFGVRTRLNDLLPGVKVTVLGPPTLKQSKEIAREKGTPSEYWHLAAAAAELELRADRGARLFPHVTPVPLRSLPPGMRWYLRHLDGLHGEQRLELVRSLDDAMNNTSVILLFEACGKKLLFPGDAQWEDWAYALKHPEIKKRLRSVDVYKVGHHGSRNATPKTLWKGFRKKSRKKGARGRLITVLSTKEGPYDSAEGKVPYPDLVTALRQYSELHRTDRPANKAKLLPPAPIHLAP